MSHEPSSLGTKKIKRPDCMDLVLFVIIFFGFVSPNRAAGRTEGTESRPPTEYPSSSRLFRESRPFAVSGGFTMRNKPAVFLAASYNISKDFSASARIGLFLAGYRVGADIIYNILNLDTTPFIGLGSYANLNFDDAAYKTATLVQHEGRGTPVQKSRHVQIKILTPPTVFLNPSIGVNHHTYSSFIASASIGYAFQILGRGFIIADKKHNYKPIRDEASGRYGQGFTFTLSLGRIF